MAYQWAECDRDFVSRRYDRIASLITFFDWLLFVPTEFRREAARTTAEEGDCVLEIGCGTGRNLAYLRDAVGPTGQVYGVDFSEGMLAHAREVVRQNGWTNVTLVCADAAEYVAPEPLDGVMFGLSYNTMPNHRQVLSHAMSQLRPGGRVVIMDSRLPEGRLWKLILPVTEWMMKRTLLGNPNIRPWEHLAAETERFELRALRFGAYYICRGNKPKSAYARRHGETEKRVELVA